MTIEDDIAFLERIPILRRLGAPALRILAISAESYHVEPGQVLFSAGETAEDLSVDRLRERGAYILGDPDDVASELAELSATLGGFGTLLLVGGKDVSSAEGRARSMALFASEVAPRLRARAAAVGSLD